MKRSLEDFLLGMLARLLPSGPRPLTLDEIGDALDGQAVGPAEIEALFLRLTQMGISVTEQDTALVPLLRQVIATAHALRKEGLSANPSAISERSGLSVRAIRVALLYADVLKG